MHIVLLNQLHNAGEQREVTARGATATGADGVSDRQGGHGGGDDADDGQARHSHGFDLTILIRQPPEAAGLITLSAYKG